MPRFLQLKDGFQVVKHTWMEMYKCLCLTHNFLEERYREISSILENYSSSVVTQFIPSYFVD